MQYLQEFSVENLKHFLGNNLTDMLIEWSDEYGNLFTKTKLIDTIHTVYGYDILKNKEFRKELLYKMKEKEINSFNEVLTLDTHFLDEMIDIISSKKWGKNKTTFHFLELLEVEYNILDETDSTTLSHELITAHDIFYDLLDYQYIIKQQSLNILNSKIIKIPRFLIHMPTGTGKTKTAMHILIHYYNFILKQKGLIIWMAHTTELLDQAIETLTLTWSHLGLGTTNLYKLFGDNELDDTPLMNGFLICGFQKLISLQ